MLRAADGAIQRVLIGAPHVNHRHAAASATRPGVCATKGAAQQHGQRVAADESQIRLHGRPSQETGQAAIQGHRPLVTLAESTWRSSDTLACVPSDSTGPAPGCCMARQACRSSRLTRAAAATAAASCSGSVSPTKTSSAWCSGQGTPRKRASQASTDASAGPTSLTARELGLVCGPLQRCGYGSAQAGGPRTEALLTWQAQRAAQLGGQRRRRVAAHVQDDVRVSAGLHLRAAEGADLTASASASQDR